MAQIFSFLLEKLRMFCPQPQNLMENIFFIHARHLMVQEEHQFFLQVLIKLLQFKKEYSLLKMNIK